VRLRIHCGAEHRALRQETRATEGLLLHNDSIGLNRMCFRDLRTSFRLEVERAARHARTWRTYLVGVQQRVEILKTLYKSVGCAGFASSLDEPEGGGTRRVLQQGALKKQRSYSKPMRRFAEQNRTIIFITHKLEAGHVDKRSDHGNAVWARCRPNATLKRLLKKMSLE